MERYDIYKDIADRTGGDIYIGVVGPVRTGKSTFISRFMDKMVLPNISGKNKKQIALDELPQSAEGKTIMTTEPKFIPGEGVNIGLKDASARIRLIDCVGYMVEGASGGMEDGSPRMVKTPWKEEPMPFEKAAEFGTEKVIKEHSTIGVVITCDGSISGIDRANYVIPEEKVINELKSINKPFIVLLNSKNPQSEEAIKLRNSMQKKYNVPVVLMSVLDAQEEDFKGLLEKVLFEFPLKVCKITIPKWLQALPYDSKIIQDICSSLITGGEKVFKMKDCGILGSCLDDKEKLKFDNIECKLGEGKVEMNISVDNGLFYEVLCEQTGEDIKDEFSLVSYVKNLRTAKECYEKIKDALPVVEDFGYGIVNPSANEIELGEPQVVKMGGRFGVKIGAKSTSYHVMKIEINSNVIPISGTKEQCEDFVKYLEDTQDLWNVNIFGKNLSEIVRDEMGHKLNAMPQEAQNKMRRTISRIVNEGKGGVICLLL